MSLWNVGFSDSAAAARAGTAPAATTARTVTRNVARLISTSPAGVNLPGLAHKVETPESAYLFNSSVTFRLRWVRCDRMEHMRRLRCYHGGDIG